MGPDGDGALRPVHVVPTARPLDAASAAWVRGLTTGGAEHEDTLRRLHALLVTVARGEAHRRAPRYGFGGPEADDLAHQAADDALLTIRAKVGGFRGESRFTTWAYAVVIFELSAKIGRHFWRNPPVRLESEAWERLPDRFGFEPEREAEWRDLLAAVHRGVDEVLTPHQRHVFVSVVVDGVPLDALADALGVPRNAVYKALFDARRKLRAHLVAGGYLSERRAGAAKGRVRRS